jgi:hypothetical protein
MHHIHPSLMFNLKRPILLLVLHFIKCILIVQVFFPDISSWDIPCFNQIKPLLLFLYHHASLIFNSLQNSTLYYIHTYMNISIFIYTYMCSFNIFHFLIFSFPHLSPIVPSDTLWHSFDLSCYICVHIYLCMWLYIIHIYI